MEKLLLYKQYKSNMLIKVSFFFRPRFIISFGFHPLNYVINRINLVNQIPDDDRQLHLITLKNQAK